MNNAKIVGAFAAAGFLLSFVSGLFSGGGALRIIGMAVLFAVVFALLGVAIVWLTKGLMTADGSSGGGGDTGSADGSAAVDKNAKPGSVVDVVVKDDELPSEENSPRFFVGNNHQMLKDSDYGAKAQGPDLLAASRPSAESIAALSPSGAGAANSAAGGTAAASAPAAHSAAAPSGAANAGAGSKDAAPGAASAPAPSPAADGPKFEPITLGKEKLQSTSAPAEAPAATAAPAASQGGGGLGDELDEIPEFEGFAAVQDDGAARNIDGDMIEDSSFSQAGAPAKKREPQTGPQDAALMAKAISTVLANDNRG